MQITERKITRRHVMQALKTARAAAEAADGSEASFTELYDTASAYEQTLWGFFGERFPPQEDEQRVAQLGLNKKDTVEGLLDHAIDRVYGMLARLGTLREVLNVLTLGGALVKYYEDIFVLLDPKPVKLNAEEEDLAHRNLKGSRALLFWPSFCKASVFIRTI